MIRMIGFISLVALVGISQGETVQLISQGPKQVFAGLGVSEVNPPPYGSLSSERKNQVSDLLFGQMKARYIRFWGTDPGTFTNTYVNTGYLSRAKSHGLKGFVLAPGRTSADNIANAVASIKNSSGLSEAATGVMNELNMPANHIFNPPGAPYYNPTQHKDMVKQIRSALNSRGLSSAKIIGPESVQCPADSICAPSFAGDDGRYWDALKSDAQALSGLNGFATHSYADGFDPVISAEVFAAGKEYWQTEHSLFGKKVIGLQTENELGFLTLATLMGDVNNHCTHWFYFIGYGQGWNDGDGGAKLLNGEPSRGADWLYLTKHFKLLRQFSSAIDPGARIYQLMADRPIPTRTMAYEAGQDPRILSVLGRNPDGTWGLNLMNFSGVSSDWSDGKEVIYGGMYVRIQSTRAARWSVQVRVPELSQVGTIQFKVEKSTRNTDQAAQSSVNMVNGVLDLELENLDFFSLRSVQSVDPGASNPEPLPVRTIPANGRLEAESADQLQGLVVMDGNRLGSTGEGDWAKFSRLNLNKKWTALALEYGVPNEYAGNVVEIRLGGTTGSMLASFTLQGTGAWSMMRLDTVPITLPLDSIQDLYMVIKKSAGTVNDWTGDLGALQFIQDAPVLLFNPVKRSQMTRKNKSFWTLDGKIAKEY